MFKKIIIGLAASLLSLAAYATDDHYDSERDDDDKGMGQLCGPAGIWSGGGQTNTKYLFKVTESSPGHFTTVAWGNYVTIPPYPMMTQWFGELKENRDGSHSIMFVAHMGTADPDEFPLTSPPQYAALKGTVRMVGCDRLEAEYDLFGIWDWGADPFVDDPMEIVKPAPFYEDYKRITVPHAPWSEHKHRHEHGHH